LHYEDLHGQLSPDAFDLAGECNSDSVFVVSVVVSDFCIGLQFAASLAELLVTTTGTVEPFVSSTQPKKH
jgi:hypothetical protein